MIGREDRKAVNLSVGEEIQLSFDEHRRESQGNNIDVVMHLEYRL